jgi:hypothetical protein
MNEGLGTYFEETHPLQERLLKGACGSLMCYSWQEGTRMVEKESALKTLACLETRLFRKKTGYWKYLLSKETLLRSAKQGRDRRSQAILFSVERS